MKNFLEMSIFNKYLNDICHENCDDKAKPLRSITQAVLFLYFSLKYLNKLKFKVPSQNKPKNKRLSSN